MVSPPQLPVISSNISLQLPTTLESDPRVFLVPIFFDPCPRAQHFVSSVGPSSSSLPKSGSTNTSFYFPSSDYSQPSPASFQFFASCLDPSSSSFSPDLMNFPTSATPFPSNPPELGPHFPLTSNHSTTVPTPLVTKPSTSGFFEGTSLSPPDFGEAPRASTGLGIASEPSVNPPFGKLAKTIKKFKGFKARRRKIY